jgi:Type II secretion system (T2SS), protein M subtype b
MKSAFHFFVVLALSVILLLGGEIFLLARSRSDLETLKLANQLQIETNNRLEAEIDGLKLSRARIVALFTRLNESIVKGKSSELGRNLSSRLPVAAPEGDQEFSVIARMTEMGVVTQSARVPNGETATIYVGGSSNLEFTRLVSLIADLENANAFLYFDKLSLNRPAAVPAFSIRPTYLDCRFTVRMLGGK